MGKAGQPNSSIKDDYASEGLAAAVQHWQQAVAVQPRGWWANSSGGCWLVVLMRQRLVQCRKQAIVDLQ